MGKTYKDDKDSRNNHFSSASRRERRGNNGTRPGLAKGHSGLSGDDCLEEMFQSRFLLASDDMANDTAEESF